jgi:PPE-repeat protein
MQARATAAAFELAHAMTVPPPAVAANRTQLATLVATNFFGQNTAAIAATDAQYAEYWAQDAAAMYAYAASAAATAQLTPFPSPRQTTNPDGVSAQDAAVTQALNNAASNPLSQAASGSQADALDSVPPNDFTFLDGAVALFGSTNNIASLEAFPEHIIGAGSNLGTLPSLTAAVTPAEVSPLTAPLSGVASSLGGGAGLGNVTAAVGRAGSIGSMSVPAGWTAPSSSPVAVLPGGGLPTLPGTGEPAGSGSGVPGIPGMRAASRATLVVPRYGVRITVMPRPPCAG